MTTEYIVPRPVSEEIHSLYIEKNEDEYLQLLEKSFNNTDFNLFWELATVSIAINEPRNKIPVILKKFFSNNFSQLDKKLLPQFLDGFAYFLQNQTKLSKTDISNFLSDRENELFVTIFHTEKIEYLPLFSPLRTKTTLNDYYALHEKLIIEGNTLGLDALYRSCTHINYDHNMVLKLYPYFDFFNYSFIKEKINEYSLDINDITNFRGDKIAFTHKMFHQKNIPQEFIFNFLKDFGKTVNIDLCGFGNKTILDILTGYTKKTTIDSLSSLENILNFCSLSEKHIAIISNYILTAPMVAEFYDHKVYSSLFNQPVFQSKYFDKYAILNTILSFDNNLTVVAVRNKNNSSINPVMVLLDKFFISENQQQNIYTDRKEHPFIIWAKNQGSNFCLDICHYLFNHYQSELVQMDSKDFNKINLALRKELKALGLVNINTQGFFDILLRKKEQIKETTIQKVETTNDYTIEKFNTVLIEQIKNNEIKIYIDSIIMNAEQYSMTFAHKEVYTNKINDNTYYIENILPNFINKALDSYLNFASIEPTEANEHLLVQLKLINKKTGDILKDSLLTEKHNMQTIQNSNMDKY